MARISSTSLANPNRSAKALCNRPVVTAAKALQDRNVSVKKRLRNKILEDYLEIVRASLLAGFAFELPSNAGRIYICEKHTSRPTPYSYGKFIKTGINERSFNTNRPGKTYEVKVVNGWLNQYGYRFRKSPTMGGLLYNILTKTNIPYRPSHVY